MKTILLFAILTSAMAISVGAVTPNRPNQIFARRSAASELQGRQHERSLELLSKQIST